MTSPRTRSLALAAAASALALVLAGCGDDPENTAADPAAQDSQSASPQPTEPSPTAPASPTTSPGTGTVTVPAYFVGDAPAGPRLYREFRKVQSDNPLEEAAALVVAGDALDPDYRTLFPAGGGIDDVGLDDSGVVEVTVSDDSWSERPSGMTKAQARLAVQSLVYTLQGAAQARVPVTVVGKEGGPAVPLLGVETAGGVKQAPELDVLNLVNVTEPQEGARVSGTFTASGVGSSFEATIPWEIRKGDRVVKEGFATAEGWMEKLYPWTTDVDVSDLAPGRYTFAALTDDPSGGAEGFGPSEDTRTITVE